jgi:hypothetical protein
MDGWDVVLPRALEGIGIVLVTDHDSDFGRKKASFNIVYDGLEV